MYVSISASGTPAQAKQSIKAQIKSARQVNKGHGAAIAAFGDAIKQQITKATEKASVSVSASLVISTTITEPKEEPKAEAAEGEANVDGE